MPKYYFAPDDLCGSTISIKNETAHHLLHVLRIKKGDTLILCDGQKTDYTATVTEVNKKPHTVILNISATCLPSPSGTEPATKITLYQSLPKGDKLNLIIQKCIELGIHEIIPVETTRSVVKAKTQKNERHQKIAASAAGQSMRGIIPMVRETLFFKDALKTIEGTTIVAYEDEQTTILKVALADKPKCISLWIGPEGGFTNEEINALKATGAITVTLGKRILRTETAAIAATAQILCLLEE